MSTTHTPGPWKIISGNANKAFNKASIRPVTSPFRGLVLPIASVRYMHESFGQANAHLIAAAPDLLEALKLCEGNISSLAAAHPQIYSKWLFVVRGAITKATGETN